MACRKILFLLVIYSIECDCSQLFKIRSSLFSQRVSTSSTRRALQLTGGSNAATLTLRIRLPDGALKRVQLSELSITARDILKELQVSDAAVIFENSELDLSRPLSSVGLKHGSLLTVRGTKQTPKSEDGLPSFRAEKRKNLFDPYPDLAKDYGAALIKSKLKQGGGSYSTMASLHASMHTIEPQAASSVHRIYIDGKTATRFQTNCIVKNKLHCRTGLLLGTLTRERKDTKKVARTSLSSIVPEDQYCQAAKVHAIWEPPMQSGGSTYDSSSLIEWRTRYPVVQRVATALGLQPLGWIFSYDAVAESSRSGNDGLPVYGQDVKIGASLQIEEMAAWDNDTFITLAMNARDGTTEAFQLSDVAVQMVAEGYLDNLHGDRYVSTKHPVVVDGKETMQLDSVLCLVNTAMLSHSGMYSGNSSVKKKTGTLTKSSCSTLLKKLKNSDDSALLEFLADFNLLVALDELLSPVDSKVLCSTVRKWARGQKKSTTVDGDLKRKLKMLFDAA